MTTKNEDCVLYVLDNSDHILFSIVSTCEKQD